LGHFTYNVCQNAKYRKLMFYCKLCDCMFHLSGWILWHLL